MPLTPYSGPIIDSHLHLFDPRRPQGIPGPSRATRCMPRICRRTIGGWQANIT